MRMEEVKGRSAAPGRQEHAVIEVEGRYIRLTAKDTWSTRLIGPQPSPSIWLRRMGWNWWTTTGC